jgi:hypothetical protein
MSLSGPELGIVEGDADGAPAAEAAGVPVEPLGELTTASSDAAAVGTAAGVESLGVVAAGVAAELLQAPRSDTTAVIATAIENRSLRGDGPFAADIFVCLEV